MPHRRCLHSSFQSCMRLSGDPFRPVAHGSSTWPENPPPNQHWVDMSRVPNLHGLVCEVAVYKDGLGTAGTVASRNELSGERLKSGCLRGDHALKHALERAFGGVHESSLKAIWRRESRPIRLGKGNKSGGLLPPPLVRLRDG